jgi:hypothetical protein
VEFSTADPPLRGRPYEDTGLKPSFYGWLEHPVLTGEKLDPEKLKWQQEYLLRYADAWFYVYEKFAQHLPEWYERCKCICELPFKPAPVPLPPPLIIIK